MAHDPTAPSAPPVVVPDSVQTTGTGWPDLDDPSCRGRWFDGEPAATLARSLPIYPLRAPGLPPIGPMLLTAAVRAGDPPLPSAVRWSVSRRTDEGPGANLHALVRFALYRSGLILHIESPDGTESPIRLLPGLQDGSSVYGPPAQPVPLMIVGKCLGVQEESQGRPFVGRGSNPLWQAWEEVGLPPRSAGLAYLTNVARYVPPPWTQNRLTANMLKDGTYLLHQELRLVRPTWVWALGSDAAKAVFRESVKVRDLIGSVASVTLDGRRSEDDPADEFTVNVVVTEHPAAIARDVAHFPVFRMGAKMLAVKSGLGSGGVSAAVPRDPPPDYRPIYTTAELEAAIAEAVDGSRFGGYVAVDCEWQGRFPADPGAYLYTVQFSYRPGWARSVLVRRRGGLRNPSLDPAALQAGLTELLAHAPARGARVVGHNLKADLPWLASLGVDLYDALLAPEDDPNAAEAAAEASNTTTPMPRFGSNQPRFGWQKTYVEGVFDTYVAAHSIEETATHKLEVLAATELGVERWDGPILRWLEDQTGPLEGYGEVPEDIIVPYGCADVDYTGRLYLHLNGDPRTGQPGRLDADRFGENARPGYWTRWSGMAAVAEMERVGLLLDMVEHKRLRDLLASARAVIQQRVREALNWPDFNFRSHAQLREALFGEAYASSSVERIGVCRLNLEPYKATEAHGGKLWPEAVAQAEREGLPTPIPSTDSETLLARVQDHPVVHDFLRLRVLNTALDRLFRQPEHERCENARWWRPAASTDREDDAEGVVVPEFTRGLCRYVSPADGRIRSRFGLAESGRLRSSEPNCQNIQGADRDETLRQILLSADPTLNPDTLQFRSRAMFIAPPGHHLVFTDLVGAEICVAAWLSGDPLLIEHAARSALPKDHPDYLDLHCDLAVRAFKLPCAPTKKAFGREYARYRSAAKPARFQLYYGAEAQSIWRSAQEVDPSITLSDIETLIEAHNATYPVLMEFFRQAQRRSHRPGWLRMPGGGMRRARSMADAELVARQEREFQNVVCQGPVAESIHQMLYHLLRVRKQWGLQFQVILSVHDSIGLSVPHAETELVVDTVLPLCMQKLAPFIPTDLDGRPVDRGPFYFSLETTVGHRWEVELDESVWRAESRAARNSATTV